MTHFWVALTVFAAVLTGSLNADAQSAGVIQSVTGDALVLRIGGTVDLADVGVLVQSGDTVRTGNGQVHVRFADDSQLTMKPHSRIRVETFQFGAKIEEQSSILRLLKGTLRMVSGLIAQRAPHRVQLRAGTATLGIRGTEFTVTRCSGDCLHTGQDKGTAANGLGLHLPGQESVLHPEVERAVLTAAARAPEQLSASMHEDGLYSATHSGLVLVTTSSGQYQQKPGEQHHFGEAGERPSATQAGPPQILLRHRLAHPERVGLHLPTVTEQSIAGLFPAKDGDLSKLAQTVRDMAQRINPCRHFACPSMDCRLANDQLAALREGQRALLNQGALLHELELVALENHGMHWDTDHVGFPTLADIGSVLAISEQLLSVGQALIPAQRLRDYLEATIEHLAHSPRVETAVLDELRDVTDILEVNVERLQWWL
ncbi:MAG: FecR domain-containing protein, partial [Chromatiales bacterium]|nr:FecR domain-containing protein [Chromatiales bacterium]